jgi:hypothetical protein
MLGERRHVAQDSRPIVDVIDQDDCRLLIDQRLDRLARRGQPQRRAGAGRRYSFGDVEVGREAVGLGEDDIAIRPQRQRRMKDLVDVDRSGVGHHRLARVGADQAGQAVAQRVGQREPAGGIPAADQAIAPFAPCRLFELGEGSLRRRSERVAVEVDHAVGQREALAQTPQRIGRIEDCDVSHFIQGGTGRLFSRRKAGLKSFD